MVLELDNVNYAGLEAINPICKNCQHFTEDNTCVSPDALESIDGWGGVVNKPDVWVCPFHELKSVG